MIDKFVLELIGFLTPAVALLALLLFFPEKIEKWSALAWKAIGWFGILGRKAKKKYIKHDLQGRMNDFVKHLRKSTPELPKEKLVIEWVDTDIGRKSFIADGNVVLRLHSSDRKDHNFVHAAYLYISTALLYKAKRYLSPIQREAIDLYMCAELLKKEKPSTVDFFLQKYLHPQAKKKKARLTNYLDDFVQIDHNNLFAHILLKELHYLGDKVFGRRQDDQIIKEVNGLINFLKQISNRMIGDENDTDFNGVYCKFGIIIIGRREKLVNSINPYINFIRRNFVEKSIETIYLLSRRENAHYLKEIIQPFLNDYSLVRNVRLNQVFRYDNDRREQVKCCLMVLRLKDIKMIVPSRF